MRPLGELRKDGAFVARTLNLAATEPLLRKRCAELERIATQLTAMTEEVSQRFQELKSGVKRSTKEIARNRAGRDEKLRQFNALLRPHTWSLELAGWADKAGQAFPTFVDLPTLGGDAGMMVIVIELARAGLLDRLRKCECGQWFFALKPWGKSCSGICRKAKARAKPKFKDGNAIYQKGYYRANLSPHQEYYRKGLLPSQVRELMKKRKRRAKEKMNVKKR